MTDPILDGYNTLDNLTPNEAKRFEALKVAFHLAKAELYGNQLNQIMDAPLEVDLAKDARAFHHIVTGDKVEINPDDRECMRVIAREIVEANDLAMRNLEFASASRRQALKDEYLVSLSPFQRIAFFRDGSLETRVEEYVINRLDERVV